MAPQGTPLVSRPEVRAFAEELDRRHGLAADATLELLAEAQAQPAIIALMDRHVTGDPSWLRYRARFVTARRIQEGTAFMADHEAALERASRTYGVPPEIITAIIGVETAYGRNTGSYRVLDALTTLAFDYPRRGAFFRDELEAFLVHARDDRIDARSIRGSYAGAIGIPQFMPGSILRWAVDFDNDGRRDLLGSAEDAIGSVARYLQAHGWQAGEPGGWLARAHGEGWKSRISTRFAPEHTVAELGQHGVHVQPGAGKPAGQTRVALIALDSPGVRPTLYLGTTNFEAITRYNRSSFYAMAVIDLASGIEADRQGRRPR
jgi:membrane-bound lytic murein transglycosylase B